MATLESLQGVIGVAGYIAVVLFLIALVIVWMLLPFAIFGIKPKLDEIQRQLKEANTHLSQMVSLIRISVMDEPVPDRHGAAPVNAERDAPTERPRLDGRQEPRR